MKKLFSIVATLCFLLLAGQSAAQAPSNSWDSGRPQLSRAELTALLERLESLTQSGAYSSDLRAQAPDRTGRP